jgi:hypothetical protein
MLTFHKVSVDQRNVLNSTTCKTLTGISLLTALYLFSARVYSALIPAASVLHKTSQMISYKVYFTYKLRDFQKADRQT